ncbi:MAG: acetyl-CoA hydrolase/transferase C-terminal domain-containing protein [Eubacteriales bacterium]|jgi:4-hydroxybutyrate CoA-transferase|nr:acetyl-CoA hydrolase/transferase C-terminal domain-containing protein [Eubacteriales bacterium]MDD3290187.1 acetyl-CoA hydrolase/transferase C-terminal domain-containing protein [Eubacteriales bacterium]MDD3863768.1 acetyl-CoA hydrolase/transferase C-terminal domain-containing protein [Eubacteriales bacterium]MDD4444417.1 acetyl-CoA hydrolase/transferase C-terminal domain-containing protein [Eubacteriales bacterium]
MNWRTIYEERRVTAQEALSHIRPGDAVVPAHAASEPRYLIDELLKRKEELSDVKIVQGLNIGLAPYAAAEYDGHFNVHSFFLGKNNRKAVQEGRGEMIPIHFYAQPRGFRDGFIPCDVALISCTPPNEDGYVNMGLSCDQTRVIVEKAGIAIAQVNDHVPHTCGDTLIHVSDIDFFVEHNEDMYEIPPISSSDPIAEKIGANIAALIRDGDTLQMGQGTVPNAILKFLEDKKDLGVHTEVFSDNLLPLIELGVVNGARKTFHRGKIVATFIQGSKELYRYVDHNSMIEMMPVDYTNDVANIAKNDNMVAINSALEVDLMGQVVADSIGTKMFSGVGGQLDFLRGAEQSRGGRPVIALPSTAKGGTISRIVAVLKPGTPVTTTRQDVHWVVTEYGAVNLFGKPIRQRAELLISIAHPDFRDRLAADFDHYLKDAGVFNGFAL